MQCLSRHIIRDYVDRNISDISWVSDSVDYHFRLKETQNSFGNLSGLLPHCSSSLFDDVKGELEEGILSAINEILYKLMGSTDRENSSENGGTHDMVHRIMSFVDPTFYDTLRFDFLRPRKVSNFDTRIIMFLTKSPDSPWQTAEQALHEIRKERRNRMEQIDEYSEYFVAAADEDRVWLERSSIRARHPRTRKTLFGDALKSVF